MPGRRRQVDNYIFLSLLSGDPALSDPFWLSVTKIQKMNYFISLVIFRKFVLSQKRKGEGKCLERNKQGKKGWDLHVRKVQALSYTSSIQ